MSASLDAKRTLREAKQLEAQEAHGEYARCAEEMKQMRAELHAHDEQETKLCNAVVTAGRSHKAAVSKVQKAREALEQARTAYETAEVQVQQAEARLQQKQTQEQGAAESLQQHKVAGDAIRNAIVAKEDDLMRASAAKDDKAGIAKAAALALEDALQCSASSSGLEPAKKKAMVSIPSWSTGKIYSASAKYWEPSSGGWVKGYPHQGSQTYKQRFILHFDSGNNSHTCIAKSTFDFLGLATTATHRGVVAITGVHGQSRQCPLYEIKFSVDIVDNSHQDPSRIFARTVTAAVIETNSNPGEVGHFDLLVNAEDTSKFANLEVHGKKFKFEVLSNVPSTLYDGQPLCTHERYSATPPAPRPQGPSDPSEIFRHFFGTGPFTRATVPTCVMAAA